ncbi:MAG: PEP-CTERM sorting domain-containing protein [Zoogloeaceae bacterium]|nr:PEP-CTERM sorting domain-containing protein [Zoogloeaceae bacterium]
MKSTQHLLCAAGIALACAAQAGTITNIVNTGPAFGGYFYSDTTLEWSHAPILTPFQSATLTIDALDVEFDAVPPEQDRVSAYDTATSSWIELGFLNGPPSGSSTVFDLLPSLFDDIASGLMVKIDINVGTTAVDYAMTLTRSTLAVTDPDTPPSIPEPGTLALAGLGLAALAHRRHRRSV